MKQRVFLFTDTNCVELVNPVDIELFRNDAHAVINPDISKMAHVPRHFWKLVDGKIEPMTAEERAERSQALLKNRPLPVKPVQLKVVEKPEVEALGLGLTDLESEIKKLQGLIESIPKPEPVPTYAKQLLVLEALAVLVLIVDLLKAFGVLK